MRKVVLALILAGAVAGALVWGFLQRQGGRRNEEEKASASVGRHRQAPDADATVTLEEHAEERIGLQLASVTLTNFSREIRGYGRVLDPTLLVARIMDFLTADVTAVASARELERLKILSAENNAAARSLQAAEAVARRDALLAQAARNKIVLEWGLPLDAPGDLRTFVHSLSADEKVLVRIDLRSDDELQLQTTPASARLASIADGSQIGEAVFLGRAPSLDPQSQGASFLFLARADPARLVPGLALIGYLKIPGRSLEGIVIPRSSLVRYAAKPWIYVRAGEHQFARREIVLEVPLERGWLVRSGISAADQVVTRGAQMLLSEELKSLGLVGGVTD